MKLRRDCALSERILSGHILGRECMKLRSFSKERCLSTLLLVLLLPVSLSYAALGFSGEVNSSNINLRTDSTVSAKTICALNKGDIVEVVLQAYGWYKVRLPKSAPSFIRKDLVTVLADKTAKISKELVNIRLAPNEASPIIGKAQLNEVLYVTGEEGEWYKIEPVQNSFGWVWAKFINKTDLPLPKIAAPAVIPLANPLASQAATPEQKIPLKEDRPQAEETLLWEGTIMPYGKVFWRKATHKLITKDNKTFLVKGNKQGLDDLNYHKVKVSGKLISPATDKTPIIEVAKIEVAD